jgi:integrase
MQLPLGVGAHSLRHSFTSRMNEAGCIDRIQDALLGHAPATLTGRYGKVTLEMMHKELIKLK